MRIVAANQHKHTYDAKEVLVKEEGEVILIYFKFACTFYVSLAKHSCSLR